MDANIIIKQRAIDQFYDLLKALNSGYLPDYLHILNKITFIETACHLKKINRVYEYLTLN